MPYYFQTLDEMERSPAPVVCNATDYPAGSTTGLHHHAYHHQLIHALHGVMMVSADAGLWIVPPTRGIWMPAGTPHLVRHIGDVQMRSLFVRPDAAPGLPTEAQVVGISPLLRELIRAAADVAPSYQRDSRDGRLMRFLLDELRALPVLPMHLPRPSDARLQRICSHIQQQPDDNTSLADWAAQLHVNPKTLQRLFARDTGMSFARWRQQARLLQALELLAQGEKVIDVALATGYDSPGAFATMFKKQLGQSPSSFYAP